MIALWIYLTIGVLVLSVMFLKNRKTGVDTSTSQLLASFRGPLTWREKFLESYVVPVLAGGLLIVGWPVALWMAWREKRNDALEAIRKEEARFRVRVGDLRERKSTEEVEASSLIVDPLHAVPALPFGHLNPVWKKFLAGRPEQAELWAFERTWTSEWSVCYLRQGFVWVTADQPGQWMLTLDQRVEKEND